LVAVAVSVTSFVAVSLTSLPPLSAVGAVEVVEVVVAVAIASLPLPLTLLPVDIVPAASDFALLLTSLAAAAAAAAATSETAAVGAAVGCTVKEKYAACTVSTVVDEVVAEEVHLPVTSERSEQSIAGEIVDC
jgi:hypothetical protein